jgi:hypothetical protein
VFYFACFFKIYHPIIPKLIREISKGIPQKASSISIIIFPPTERALNKVSASSLLSGLMESEKLLLQTILFPNNSKLSLPVMAVYLLMGNETYIIFFASA